MFTGIIEDLGSIVGVAPLEAGKRMTVRTALAVADMELGESIAVNGACMTVVGTDTDNSTFSFDVSPESLRRTTLEDFRDGVAVNVERSMRLNQRIGGHVVSGHVDGTGEVSEIKREGESSLYTFSMAPELARLTVEKGSIAIDGISLTCFRCTGTTIDVALIPHTMAVTTLGAKQPGDRVNVENDVLAKYVERLIEPVVAARGSQQSGQD